jgi:methyl-accepting chemotaxis protein
MDDFSQLTAMLHEKQAIPDAPLPSGIAASYDGDIPDSISADLLRTGQNVGLRIIAPIYHNEKKTGVLVGEVLYTQSMVERYALLSETDVNFFAGDQLSVGTLAAQTQLDPNASEQLVACEEILSSNQEINVSSVTFDQQDYYQGRCALKNSQSTIGTITVSLSQDIEKQEVHRILKAVLSISGIVIGVALVLSLLFSRKTIRSIHHIVSVIGAAAEGDLRKTAMTMTHDEIGMLAMKLNQMITQLQTIAGQVQKSSYAVNSTADTILQQMETLIQHMEQQSASVDNTTISIEKIKLFIDVVARNTTELLAAAEQILSSIRETHASIEEVTKSTGSLMTNLHLISSSVDQVSQSVKHVAGNIEQLENVAQHTETEIHHIDQSLRNVSQNANQAQQLAKETMDAATSGQASVEASIQGMAELKEVVINTAQIIQEVNTWGEQVSSILGIVDDITEQTSLLALNASIISAQAGVHGRGFAVVADEIKELAIRTKASTKEIGTLIHELQKKTGEGVNHTAEGLKKADQGMELADAVKDALSVILGRATHSSKRASDTAQVMQQTADSSQAIRSSISSVTKMVSEIRTAIQEQEQDIEQVVVAVENISSMSTQVNRASVEQKNATSQIAGSMEHIAEKFSGIADQTGELKQNSDQIVTAMHTIESTTEQILQNASDISGDTVKNLVRQSVVLQKVVNVFKVS